MTRKLVRCAIYTRKSTDEGLEQDFNSLDAQREACGAFIKSQRELGWKPLTRRYDDGGYSGGTTDRPALQALLEDIEGGKIDLIVVYKVDRLTRSLTDFAKMVELFDSKNVSFVSVTQQFNTSSSMGRLTLNVLLSFAQFEREVTAERIRDKIAASKKKGMWMGGLPALGYDARDKRLRVHAAEAEIVRALFRKYLALGTVPKLAAFAKRHGLLTKVRTDSNGKETGGRPFARGHLYQLLTNPIYIGEVAHKGKTYPGQHEAIIDRLTFEAVRLQLNVNRTRCDTTPHAKSESLLQGLLFDETGDRLCPSHARKRGRRYRYYVSRKLITGPSTEAEGWRLPAKEVEDLVTDMLVRLLNDDRRVLDSLNLGEVAPERLHAILKRAKVAAKALADGEPTNQRDLLRRLVQRVTLLHDSIRLDIKQPELWNLCSKEPQNGSKLTDGPLSLIIPVVLKRRGVEAKLVMRTEQGFAAKPDEKLTALLAEAHQRFDALRSGKVPSVRAMALRDGIDPADLGRTIQLVFLAPDIIEAILAGRQPPELTPRRLKRIGTLPLEWSRQRCLLGFPG